MCFIREVVRLPGEPGDAVGESHRELLVERVVLDGAGGAESAVESRSCGCGSCVVHHVYLGSRTSKMRPIYAKTIVCGAVLNLPKSSVPRKRGVVKERVAERRIAEKNVEVHPRGKLAIPR